MQIGILNPYQSYANNARKSFKGNEASPVEESNQEKAYDKLAEEAVLWWTKQLEDPGSVKKVETTEDNEKIDVDTINHWATQVKDIHKTRKYSDEEIQEFQKVLKPAIKELLMNSNGKEVSFHVKYHARYPLSDALFQAKMIKMKDINFTFCGTHMWIENGKIDVLVEDDGKRETVYELPENLKATLKK